MPVLLAASRFYYSDRAVLGIAILMATSVLALILRSVRNGTAVFWDREHAGLYVFAYAGIVVVAICAWVAGSTSRGRTNAPLGLVIGFASYGFLWVAVSYSCHHPGGSHSGGIASQGGHLVTGGPFRIFRHPTYHGFVTGTIAGIAFSYVLLPVTLIALVLCAISASREEESLHKVFRQDYVRYSERTRWRVLPFDWVFRR